MMDDATSNISAVQAALATELNELVLGYRRTQLFYVAAKLGLADLLASGPQSVDALAAAAHVDASSLYRLLRALAGYGAFAEQEDGRFQLTPLAALLQADLPGSLRATVLAHGEDFYRVWGELFYSVQTGEPAFDRVYGLSNWAYRQQHPEANARFNALMASMARRRAAGVLSTYRFAGHRVVVDVGGGNGTLLVALLRHYPELRGMLVDQPHVIAQAHTVLATAGVADRCIVLEGDFFAEVPAGGDFYILSEILHDWSDARASDILVRCHRAMASGAKLLIVERVVPKGNDPSPAKLIDIQMLVTNAGGRERTEHEWRRLVESAGFRVRSIVRTGEPGDILEAVPDRSCRSS
jgi:predicted O-methyltransferase YrrM